MFKKSVTRPLRKGKCLPYFNNARPLDEGQRQGAVSENKKSVVPIWLLLFVKLCKNSPAHVMCAGLIF